MIKIAIVHDWFITIGGAEKVVKQLLLEYPDADVFCVFDHFNEEQRKEILDGRRPKSTRLGKVPLSRKYYRLLTLLCFKAIEQLDLSGYDLIISSSHAVAKGVRKREGQIHICYCHTPIRYVWNMKKTYLSQIPAWYRKLALYQINRIKAWDLANTARVDRFIANSEFVASRIKTDYNRESDVSNPPVDTSYFHPAGPGEASPEAKPYHLVVSRLVHYKRVGLVVEAFNAMPDRNLVIIGGGPQLAILKKAAGANIRFLGHRPVETLRLYMQHAESALFSAIEDFGITCLEVQACATPVIAFDFGGHRETVRPGKTGILFPQQSSASIIWAVCEMDMLKPTFDRQFIRTNTLKYGPERFRSEIRELVDRTMAAHAIKG